jgi:hypothetical protein
MACKEAEDAEKKNPMLTLLLCVHSEFVAKFFLRNPRYLRAINYFTI